MKITDVICYPLWIGHRNQLIVKVETDTDIYGIGESGLSSRERAVMGAIEHYREWLIGRDPMKTGALWQEMYRSQYFEGGRVLTAAQSAIDIALYDIKGKAYNVPVYELIGGKHREAVPIFTSIPMPDTHERLDQAQGYIANGIKTFRLSRTQTTGENPAIYEPREALARDAAALTQARHDLGLEVVLGIDLHHRLNVAETASFCQKMPHGTLDFIEEPIRDESPEAYETLRKMVDVPFAIGEEFASKWQFLPYIERGITQFARVDICNVGGFTEAMKVAGWAEAHYIDLMPHNPLGPICTAASIHMCAAIPNCAWLEVWLARVGYGADSEASDLFTGLPKLKDGMLPVPEAPGIGIELDFAKVADHEFTFWEAPHLRRQDGSHQNW